MFRHSTVLLLPPLVPDAAAADAAADVEIEFVDTAHHNTNDAIPCSAFHRVDIVDVLPL